MEDRVGLRWRWEQLGDMAGDVEEAFGREGRED